MTIYKSLITIGAIACLYLMLKVIKRKLEGSDESLSPKKAEETELGKTDEIKEKESDESKVNVSCEIEKKEFDEQGPCEKTVESPHPKASKRFKLRKQAKDMQYLRPRPNFFLALQVNDVGIREKVKKLQEGIITRNPALKPALINVSTLHITLAVTHLAHKTDVESVKKILDEWAVKNLRTYFDSPCILSFKGIQTFKSGVVYVDLERDPAVKKITDLAVDMNNLLSSAGYSTESNKIVPHLTFLKLSKDLKLIRQKKLFQEELKSLTNSHEYFGKQEVKDLQLLSMNEPKDEDGYYQCFHKIKVPDLNKD